MRNLAFLQHEERGTDCCPYNLPKQVKRSMAAILASRNFQVGQITFADAEKYLLTIAALRRDREQDSSKIPADFVGEQKSK
jgi:hypothetical protein